MVSFSGNDRASKQWRREQANISNDISGIPRCRYAEALIHALDALNLSDNEKIVALTAYFSHLARASNDG